MSRGLLDEEWSANGSAVPMWYLRERAVAEVVARDYAARGHKQSYEVERVAWVAPCGGIGKTWSAG